MGNYRAAVRIGDPTRVGITRFDRDFEASEKMNMFLFAMTLLEMFGMIPKASERNPFFTKHEISQKIDSVESDEVQPSWIHFLMETLKIETLIFANALCQTNTDQRDVEAFSPSHPTVLRFLLSHVSCPFSIISSFVSL